MKFRRTIVWIFLVALAIPGKLSAQADFYDVNHIPEIRITFTQSNWDEILDSLYVEGNEDRLSASLVIDGTSLEKVGVRYKGFSSASVNRTKNPFNIDLDFAIGNQEYQGISKIKLSNVIQDPSFVREVLSYEIARKYMPASRSNFANVYVNDVLMGLYSNVEAVNKDFMEDHFGSRDLALIKGNPEELDFDGENSDFSNVHGTDVNSYHPFYELKSDFGWDEFYHLIDTLNDHPEHIENILNVDQTLWMHAFNYALINFDSYVGYAQNFYFYRSENGLWSPILWDLNMSFASFRFSDASLYWDGFNIAQAKTMDPLQHHNSVSVYPRPLLRQLFANATYRRMYLAHLRTIMQENFDNQDYAARAMFMQNKIDASVQADTNKFYSYADFQNNLTSTVTDLIDYPGITDLMDDRNAFLQTYPGFPGAPTFTNNGFSPTLPEVGSEVWITTTVSDADSVILAFRFAKDDAFSKTSMYDDGNHQDGAANDGVFGAQLTGIGYNTQYYFYAENDSAGIFSPERAAREFYEINPEITSGIIVINEIMANNRNSGEDAAGENDNWIELFNTSDFPVNIGGLSLADGNQTVATSLPDMLIPANGYQIVWADGDLGQSGIHLDFELSASGGSLYLKNALATTVDSINYGTQDFVTSLGRYPNGTGPFVEMLPSFNTFNKLGADPILTSDVFLFPNPADTEIHLKKLIDSSVDLEVISATGQVIVARRAPDGIGLSTLNTEQFAPGLYFFRMVYEDTTVTRKIIITHE